MSRHPQFHVALQELSRRRPHKVLQRTGRTSFRTQRDARGVSCATVIKRDPDFHSEVFRDSGPRLMPSTNRTSLHPSESESLYLEHITPVDVHKSSLTGLSSCRERELRAGSCETTGFTAAPIVTKRLRLGRLQNVCLSGAAGR